MYAARPQPKNMTSHGGNSKPYVPPQSTGEEKSKSAQAVYSGRKACRSNRSDHGHKNARGSVKSEGLQHGGVRRFGPASARLRRENKTRDAYSTTRFL